ncbi:MAG: MFS transporter [Gammaproteobacteria bacterium]|nr:MAG: MFS transporter [Gammaproteobacteria bacterium]UTW43463.1 MFS transporter [bacterium SCSIO 12844]
MKKSLFSLLLVVFIDAAGIGLLFPVLNTIIMDPSVYFLAKGTSDFWRHLDYGIVVAVFFLAWFFGATYISKTSDTIGRKKSLVICLIGLFLGYGLTIVAIYAKSLTLLIIGRVISGLTAGSQPVAQAAIIDISDDEHKTKNLGLIMFAFSLGMVMGPVIGGVFTSKEIYHGFNSATPFFIILAITLINLVLLALYFNDEKKAQGRFKLEILSVFTQFAPMVKLKKVRKLSIVFFIMQFAFNTFYVFVPLYLFEVYGFATLGNSILMLVLGFSMALSSRFLVPVFAKRMSNQSTVILGLAIMAVSVTLMITVKTWLVPFIIAVPFMLAFGLAYTNMLSLFSNSVDQSQQGWVMGITVSLFTSGAAITSFVGGELVDLSINLPFIITIVGFVISLWLLCLFRKSVSSCHLQKDDEVVNVH